MKVQPITMRGVIAEYYAALEQNTRESWVDAISNYFPSDQDFETYEWLGAAPSMVEKKGALKPKELRDASLVIRNKPYESSLFIPVEWLRRAKGPQIRVRIAEQVEKTMSHWASLLTTLIAAGTATAGYDGAFYFHTAHSEGDSGSQDNDRTSAIVNKDSPTAGEAEGAALTMIQAILGFKDDRGDLMNENARRFLWMVPLNYMSAAAAALKSQIILQSVSAGSVRGNTIMALGEMGGFQIELAVNGRLTATDVHYMFRADGSTKGLIRQEEFPPEPTVLDENSEYAKLNGSAIFAVETRRATGYGHWQRACVMTHTNS